MCSEACPYTDHCYCMQGKYAVLATEVGTQGMLGTHNNFVTYLHGCLVQILVSVPACITFSIVCVILEVIYAPDEVWGCD